MDEIPLPDLSSEIAERITLSYMVGAKQLGDLTKHDLVAATRKSWAGGQMELTKAHLFNRLSEMLKPDQKVSEVVSERKLEKILEEVQSSAIIVPPSSARSAVA